MWPPTPPSTTCSTRTRTSRLDTQLNPPNWGDDRIDQVDTPLNQSYVYPANAGPGRPRVRHGHRNQCHPRRLHRPHRCGPRLRRRRCLRRPTATATAPTSRAPPSAPCTASRRRATVHAVRVLNCQGSGSSADILAGIEWVKANAVRPSVVNYSIGCLGGCSDPTHGQRGQGPRSRAAPPGCSHPATANDDACRFSPQKVAEAHHGQRRDHQRRQGELSRTLAPARTCLLRAAASSRLGTPATPRPTRSAARPWPRRT